MNIPGVILIPVWLLAAVMVAGLLVSVTAMAIRGLRSSTVEVRLNTFATYSAGLLITYIIYRDLQTVSQWNSQLASLYADGRISEGERLGLLARPEVHTVLFSFGMAVAFAAALIRRACRKDNLAFAVWLLPGFVAYLTITLGAIGAVFDPEASPGFITGLCFGLTCLVSLMAVIISCYELLKRKSIAAEPVMRPAHSTSQ